jgi:cysteine desulfurase/selenocysteine lyase
MLDVTKIRNDFPMLKQTMEGKPLIYFDNGATTLKPQVVIDSIVDYYSNYSASAHRGDYSISYKVDVTYENVRKKVMNFIKASRKEEVIYTSGATESLNLAANGFFKHALKKGDEIILNYAEHASNILPWYKLSDELGVVVKFVELTDHQLSLEKIKEAVTDKTKLIAFAHVSNVLGYVLPAKEICDFAKANDIYTLVDGSQSIPHIAIDVVDMNCDFFAFSAHKMCGPTGVGILYGRYELLNEMTAYKMGGGMNARFDDKGNISYKKPPFIFEAGTPNIAGVIGFGAAIDYLENIGMDKIHAYEVELKKYAIDKISKLDNVEVYNADSESGIITFNLIDIFAQDAASHLNHYGIAVRAGHHCAKVLHNDIKTTVTCRASLYFYNTFAEIDQFVEALKKGDEYLEAIF